MRKVYSLIRELRQNGIAVISISHNINEVFDVADRFVVLKTGMLIGVRRKEETSLDEILRMIIAGSAALSPAAEEAEALPAAACEKAETGRRGKLRSSTQAIQKAEAFPSLVLMIGFFSIGSPFFMTFDNLMTVILQTSVIGILAMGVTFLIIASGIDLSLGALLAFAGMLIGKAVNAGLPMWLSVICGILVATIMGFSGQLRDAQAGHRTIHLRPGQQ